MQRWGIKMHIIRNAKEISLLSKKPYTKKEETKYQYDMHNEYKEANLFIIRLIKLAIGIIITAIILSIPYFLGKFVSTHGYIYKTFFDYSEHGPMSMIYCINGLMASAIIFLIGFYLLRPFLILFYNLTYWLIKGDTK